MIAAALFLGLAAAGAVRAPYAYAALLNGIELAACLAVFLLAAREGPGLIDLLRGPLAAGLAAHAALVLWQWAVAGISRPAGTFLNTNHMAAWMVMVGLLALGDWRSGKGRLARLLAAATLVLATAAVAASGSRGALVGLAAGLAWLGWRRWGKMGRRSRALVVVAGLCLLLLGGWVLQRRVRGPDPFLYQRFSIWRASIAVFLEDPVWGAGPGQFESAAKRHQFADPEEPFRHDRRFRIPHSDPLRLFSEFGAPAALAMLAAALLAALAIRRRRFEPDARPVSDGAVAALLAVAAHGLVDDPSRWPAVYLLASALLGGLLATRLRSQARRPTPALRAGLAAVLLGAFLLADVAPTIAHLAVEGLPRGAVDGEGRARLLAAARLNPLHPDYRLRLAEDRMSGSPVSLDDYVEARERAEEAERLQPADAAYAWGLARVEAQACIELFRDVATRDRALASFERAQRLSPTDVRVSIDAGQFLLSAGDPGGARRLAERALAIEPNAVPAKLLLAESLLAAGGPGSATRAGELLGDARSIASRWESVAGTGIYAGEMLTLDRRAEARVVGLLSGQGKAAP